MHWTELEWYNRARRRVLCKALNMTREWVLVEGFGQDKRTVSSCPRLQTRRELWAATQGFGQDKRIVSSCPRLRRKQESEILCKASYARFWTWRDVGTLASHLAQGFRQVERVGFSERLWIGWESGVCASFLCKASYERLLTQGFLHKASYTRLLTQGFGQTTTIGQESGSALRFELETWLQGHEYLSSRPWAGLYRTPHLGTRVRFWGQTRS